MSIVIGAIDAPRRNYTRIANAVLDDETLPGAARWVFSVLSRLSVGRRLDEATLMRKTDLGRNVLRRALRALESRGLITRRQQRAGLGYGDVIVYVGAPPLPTEQPVPVDPNPVNRSDQAKQGVSAGQPVDPNPVDCSMYLQDEPLREVPSALPRAVPAAPQSSTGGTMPRTRKPAPGQTALWPSAVAAVPDAVERGAATLHAAGPDNAGVILGEWLQRCAVRPPSRVIGQVGKLVREMVAEGIPGDIIRRGMAEWMRKGLHPATLPAEVNAVANAHAGGGRRSTTDDRVAATLALVGTFGEQRAISA